MNIDPEMVKKILLPALAGAAGTGALTAHISSNYKPLNENPRERRRRIMRQAMIGTALGGIAGGALPAGLAMATQPFREGHMPIGERVSDTGVRFGLNHAAAGVVAGLGGYAAHDKVQKQRTGAFKELFDLLKSTPAAPANRADLGNTLSSAAGRQQTMADYVAAIAGKGKPLEHNAFRANELMQEAGKKGLSLQELEALLKPDGVNGSRVEDAYRAFIGDQGPVSRLVSKAPRQVVEQYGRFIRPSMRASRGGVAPALMAALVGGGAVAAQQGQDWITGR